MPVGNRRGSRNQFIQLLLQSIFHHVFSFLQKMTSYVPFSQSHDIEVFGVWVTRSKHRALPCYLIAFSLICRELIRLPGSSLAPDT